MVVSDRRVGAWLASFVLAGSFACSGSTEKPDDDAAEATLVAIDDMEGPGVQIHWSPPDASAPTVPGVWISYADTQCDDLLPPPAWTTDGRNEWAHAEVPAPYETSPGVTSRHAARLRTLAPLVNTWGAGMNVSLALANEVETSPALPCARESGVTVDLAIPQVPVDLSRYRGITFWAMADESLSSTVLRVMFEDANTEPNGGNCDPVPDSPEACYNNFGADVELSGEFRRYTVEFSELAQRPGWGHRVAADGFERTKVYALSLQVETPGGFCPPPEICAGELPELEFDLWVDDLYFLED